MASRSTLLLGVFIGSTIGGLVPNLWGAGLFSYAGLIGSALGGVLGLYITYQFG